MSYATAWATSAEIVCVETAMSRVQEARRTIWQVINGSVDLVAATDWHSSATAAFRQRRDDWVSALLMRIAQCDDVETELQRLRSTLLVCTGF